MSNVCAICEKETSFINNRRKIANGEVVCNDCFLKANTLTLKQILFTKRVTAEEIRQSIIESTVNGEEVLNFKPTKEIGEFIKFDDINERIMISSFIPRFINYSDIVSFELIEDGEVVTSGGLGRALAGGVLFGGAGAIVGAVTGKKKQNHYCASLDVKITVKNSEHPAYYVNFIDKKVKTSSMEYNLAYNQTQECLSTLQLICDRRDKEKNEDNNSSNPADEIMKYKQLLDAEAITQEEYEAKKKELLGL